MIELITNNLDAIRKACEDHDVRALWVFGSAVSGDWIEGRSDVDFLVEPGESKLSLFDQYLGLIVALDKVLGRRYITHTTCVEQPGYGGFADEIRRTRIRVYESADERIFA